jgi:lambda repressor-like predicted transcriptional regulator/DNA-binding transcriptional regulator YdaS (Cro superfamily)
MDLTYTLYRRIYKLSATGKTVEEIARILKMKESAVENILSKPFSKLTGKEITGADVRADLKSQKLEEKADDRRKNDDNIDRDALIVELRKQGLTLDAIGMRVNLTRERVRQVLRRDALGLSSGAIKQGQERLKSHLKVIDHERIFSLISANWTSYCRMTFADLAKLIGISESKLKQSISPIQYVYLQANQVSTIARLWTDEQCIQSLRDAATFEFPLTVLKYRRLIESGTVKGPTVALFWQRFGSWVNACDLAGVENGEAQREYDRNWTDKELLRFVRWFMFQREDGRWSIENFETWSKGPDVSGPSTGLLRLRLGTWSQIRVLALELQLPEFTMHAFSGWDRNVK